MVSLSSYVVEVSKQTRAIPTKVLTDPRMARKVLQPLRWEILKTLMEAPSYPREIARQLKMSEQKVHHHIKALQELGMISVVRTESRRGALAKYFSADRAALSVLPDGFEKALPAEFLRFRAADVDLRRAKVQRFIPVDGVNSVVVVGSPDIHGEYRARARDGHYAVDLALFLGSLGGVPVRPGTKLDTEVAEDDLKRNLLLVGGPRVNTVSARINGELPIRFQLTERSAIVSRVSGRSYYEEETGVVERVANPFNSACEILLLAGNSILGTKASIVAMVRRLDEVSRGNALNREVAARVVQGLDLDSDGVVDDVEFLE